MLRSIGIPAGWASVQVSLIPLPIVRNTDAYAMTEVYFPKYGWFAFDSGHPLIPPSIEENRPLAF